MSESRNKIIMKKKLFKEIQDLKAKQCFDRIGEEYNENNPRHSLLKSAYESGFVDAFVWLKEKGIYILEIEE